MYLGKYKENMKHGGFWLEETLGLFGAGEVKWGGLVHCYPV